MLYVSDCDDFKQVEHFGKTYNFRLYGSIPEEFLGEQLFVPPKTKSLYSWQETIYICLSCGRKLKYYLAAKHQNLPAGGYVELELYQCQSCKKYIMLEWF
jgi:hypothetical protein